jgi:maltooligosyltrehalose trehalohydrolase
MDPSNSPPGAHVVRAGTTFTVVATTAREVAVRLFGADGAATRTVPLEPSGDARFTRHLDGVGEGALYKFVLDGEEVPDPYARFLPSGVHGPARVVGPRTARPLADPLPLHRWSIYELHVGTFSRAGTYRGAIEHLDAIAELGVTAIELLPLAAFDGARGWGYDGVALYATHAPYGELDDLRALIAAAHERRLAVVLDCVYNHFGPSGNYLSRYAPEYFTSKIQTPWGAAPDYAWPPMRRLVLDNVRYWLDELGFDGLRLDATHEIHDPSPRHVLREITDLAHERGRLVFFESDRNDPAVVTELGADAVWADDFHHHVHVLLTGERDGYYAAYDPSVAALARCIEEGWSFSGQPYAPWDGRARGKPGGPLAYEHFVTCIQNHDQVGNRALGTRLSAHVDVDAYCAAAALVLFLPETPLLFMGQEWAASTPFLFFSDHAGDLGRAVSEGRRAEFKGFSAFADESMRERIPDPQAEATFEGSRLRWEERERDPHARALAAHAALLRLRRSDAVLTEPCRRGDIDARATGAAGAVLEVTRRGHAGARRLVANFGDAPHPLGDGAHEVLFSTRPMDDGHVPPRSAVVLAVAPA